MPFAIWISSAFTWLFSFFAAFLTKKIAIVAAGITAFTAILVTFKVAVDAVISGLVSVTPSGLLLFSLQLLPDNTANCLTAVALTHVASQAYIYWRNVLAFRLT